MRCRRRVPRPDRGFAPGPGLAPGLAPVLARGLALGSALSVALSPAAALAHVSERALVLLLPTDVWVPVGVSVVAISALAVFVLPGRAVAAAFRPVRLSARGASGGEMAASLLALALLAALVWAGLAGPRDPLANPLPLAIWTLFWVGLPLAQAAFGDLWAWLNPWTGLHRLAMGDRPPPLRLPAWLGHAPAMLGWALFAFFLLVDPAPDDPARLARAVAGYWLVTAAGMALFGPAWLDRAECFTIWLGWLSRLAPLWTREGLRAGLPGARLTRMPPLVPSAAILLLVMLATGSFDGLNETFWWLGLIGVNPLEFPGRSAVMAENLAGLLAASAALVAVFAATVLAGLALIGQTRRFREAFGKLALSIVPIALGYHFAHYLTVLLVNGQYALAAASDPMATGADLLGLGTFYVTTSFFNNAGSVWAIWLAQGSAIVIGHVLAVLVAHAIAREMFGDDRRAAISQLPVAVFMTLYTWLGLWILSSPTG